GIRRLLSQQLGEALLRHAFDLDHLGSARSSEHDGHTRTRHFRQFGDEADAFLIGFAIHRRSREVELPGVAQTARDPRSFGARMYLHRDTRHSTLALKLATPAPARASTTSKAMASSSQSWLVPSAF